MARGKTSIPKKFIITKVMIESEGSRQSVKDIASKIAEKLIKENHDTVIKFEMGDCVKAVYTADSVCQIHNWFRSAYEQRIKALRILSMFIAFNSADEIAEVT
jgi:hypothetical protein